MLRAQTAIARVEKVSGTICAKHPTGRSGKWCLTLFPLETFWQSVRRIFREEAPWWGCSFAIHFVLLSLLLLAGTMPAAPDPRDVEISLVPPPAEDHSPPEIDPPDIKIPPVVDDKVSPQPDDDSNPFARDPPSGLKDPTANGDRADSASEDGVKDALVTTRTDVSRDVGSAAWDLGPGPRQVGPSFGGPPGRPGSPGPYDIRGKRGPEIFRYRSNETCVAAALNWLARHQSPDGSWSLQDYAARCRDKTCSGPGGVRADSAATALAVLPYLAAGETHRSKGKYQKTIAGGLAWLVRQQKPDGDLRCGATMYAHGLATIALCEAYGMTGDRSIGYAAQRAVDFLEAAQNKRTGGWRYQPGDEGDLSVTGWQIMALKSAQMAGLSVDAGVFQRAREYLAAVSAGQGGSAAASAGRGLFAYQPGAAPNSSMTAVGLLCSQYLGARRNDPVMTEGTARLMADLPDDAGHPLARRDLYYWYYATQVMHNQPGADWDVWNRHIRKVLVASQDREGCAAGSWDPLRPSPDPWGRQGGRLMTTCLATLTLEVYYRYIPLYKYDPEQGRGGK